MKRRAESSHTRDREEGTSRVVKCKKGVKRSTSTADHPDVNGQASPALSVITPSKRKIRSLAEKNRRDKLSSFITELSTLLPLASTPDKKLDKCDILRLAVNYLKVQKYLKSSKEEPCKSWPSWITEEQLQKLLLENTIGFLLLVDRRGTIVHVHDSVSHYLGIPQNQIVGRSIQTLVHPDDLHIVYEHVPLLQPFHLGQEDLQESVSSSAASLSFCVRVVCRNTTNKSGFFSYKFAHIKGYTQPLVEDRHGGAKLLPSLVLVAVVRPYMESVFKEMSSFFSRDNEVVLVHTLQGVLEFADQRMFKYGALPKEVLSGSVYDTVDKDDLKYVSHAHSVICDSLQTSTIYRCRRSMQLGYCHSITYVIRDWWTSQPKGFVSFFSVLSDKEGRSRWKKQDKEYREMMAGKELPTLQHGMTSIKAESLSPLSSDYFSNSPGDTIDTTPDGSHIGGHTSSSPASSSEMIGETNSVMEEHDGSTTAFPTWNKDGSASPSAEVHMGETFSNQDETVCLETVTWPGNNLLERTDTSLVQTDTQPAQFDKDSSGYDSPASVVSPSGDSSPQTLVSPTTSDWTPTHTSHPTCILQPIPSCADGDVETQNMSPQTPAHGSLLRDLIDCNGDCRMSVSPVEGSDPTLTAEKSSMRDEHNGGGLHTSPLAVGNVEKAESLSTRQHEGNVTSQHPSIAVVHPTLPNTMASSSEPDDLQKPIDHFGKAASPSEDVQQAHQAPLAASAQSLMTEEFQLHCQLTQQQRQLTRQMEQYKREMQLVQSQLDLNHCIMKLQKLKGQELANIHRDMAKDTTPHLLCLASQMANTNVDQSTESLNLPCASTAPAQRPSLAELTRKEV